MNLVLDTARALAIAVGTGAFGIPFSFWLLRHEGFSKIEKIVIGITLGWLLLPALFLAETIVGIKYSPFFVALNLGLILAFSAAIWAWEILSSKKKLSDLISFPKISADWEFFEQALPSLGLVVLLFLSVWIPLSSAGILLTEVDPYFYLYGVGQVITKGANMPNDGTVWYPLLSSSHIGNPFYKFLLASWYSLYAQAQPYSPYVLSAVSSIYPPLMLGLAVFFAYLLFKELYNPRIGIFAGGLLAFMPIVLQKMHAGNSQVVPYGFFAVFFFVAAFYLMVKRRSFPLFTIHFAGKKIPFETFTFLAILASAALTLGSNLVILLVFCLSVFLFAFGFLHLLKPTQEGWNIISQLSWLILGLLIIQIVLQLYYQTPLSAAWLKPIGEYVLLPAISLAVPVGFGAIIDKVKWPAPKQGQVSLPILVSLLLIVAAIFRLWGGLALFPLIIFGLFLNSFSSWVRSQPNPARLELCILLLGAIIFAVTEAPVLPITSSLLEGYKFWGAYAQAVTRTISEQAAGPASFDSAFGVAGITLGPAPDFGQLIPMALSYAAEGVKGLLSFSIGGILSFVLSVLGIASLLPTIFVNLFYNSVAEFMNAYLTKDGVRPDFPIVDRLNSLATLFMFFGPFLLFLSLMRAWRAGKPLPYGPILLLSFIVPVTFMGFMKIKFIVWLAFVFVFSAASAWAEGEKLVYEWLEKHYAKAKSSQGDWKASLPIHPRHLAWVLVVLAVLLEMGWPTYIFIDSGSVPVDYAVAYAQAASVLAYSHIPAFYQNPQAAMPVLSFHCKQSGQPAACLVASDLNSSISDPSIFYRADVCYLSMIGNSTSKVLPSRQVAASYRCSLFPTNWLAAYDWVAQNINSSERITSWWDYGHWTLFFGGARSVLDPTQASGEMIGRVAYSYVHAGPETLRQTMKDYGSRYALFDVEIIGSAGPNGGLVFGGKFAALNYLGCEWANLTNLSQPPGNSLCELLNQPERIIIPLSSSQSTSCMISEITQSKGVVGYRLGIGKSQQGVAQTLEPAYCVRWEKTQDGQQLGVYFLDKKDENDNLLRSPAYWLPQSSDSSQMVLAAVYTKDPWPLANGTIASRWDYRQGPFYDSSLYQAFILKSLDGFDLVYDSPSIRIFKMKDEYWGNTSVG